MNHYEYDCGCQAHATHLDMCPPHEATPLILTFLIAVNESREETSAKTWEQLHALLLRLEERVNASY